MYKEIIKNIGTDLLCLLIKFVYTKNISIHDELVGNLTESFH